MTQAVNVLFFQPSSVFGGAERSALNVINYMDPQRVRIHLLASDRVFAQVGNCDFISTTETEISEGFTGLRKALRDAWMIVRLARRHRCKVMIGFLHYGAILAGLVRVLSVGRVRTIASPRTPSQLAIRHLLGADSQQVRLWQAMIHFFCRFSTRVLVASHGLKDEAVEVYGAHPDAVDVVPNGVDEALVERAQCVNPVGVDQREFRLVSFGRLVEEKDLGTLVRAFALVATHLPHARLWLVGDGPERGALEALAAELGVLERIQFVGFQPEPYAWVKSCDVFVHTALYEGFGNVLLEAMACGVTVIATDCDYGPREIIEDGVSGRLVQPGDVEGLAACILQLAADEALRRRLVMVANERVKAFSAKAMSAGYERVFLEVAGVVARDPAATGLRY